MTIRKTAVGKERPAHVGMAIINSELTYVPAVPSDHRLLTETAYVSKQYWGYPNELMAEWKEELEVSADYILHNHAVKVYENGQFIGFFAWEERDDCDAYISHLWLLPGRIGRGYGKEIFDYMIALLNLQGIRSATLMSDPHSNGFYQKMGGRLSAQRPGKLPGRMLNMYSFDIPALLSA